MSNIYDLIIIGSGPAGLSLAQCLRNTYKKILIVEKLDVIGGCHKVIRYKTDDGKSLFTEHGPRIYSDSYKNFRMLLKDMNQDFFKLFVPYNFSISEIGGQTIFTTLKFSELLKLAWQFFLLILNNEHGINTSLKDFMTKSNFQDKSIDMIDRVARLTDGADSNRYTLNQFLQIFNQQFFHKLYQPNKPNDQGFLKIWQEFLEKEGVEFKLDTEILKLNMQNNIIKSVITTGNNEILGNKFVLAIPPESFVNILKNSDTLVQNTFMDFENLEEFSEKTEYNEYICVTFHWFEKMDLPKVYGFPKSKWGIAFIVLSDYMDLSQDDSKTLITCAITIPDAIGQNINKIANKCNKDEIINETFLQLKEAYPNLKDPDVSLLYPGNYYNKDEERWESIDEAFIASSNSGFLPFLGKISNLYNLGTQNGKQKYKFTSLESAVTNGIYLSHILNKDLEKKYPIQDIFTFRDMILLIVYFIILVICIFIVCRIYVKKCIK